MNSRVVHALEGVSRFAGAAVATVGSLGLLGWAIDAEVLKALFAGNFTIKANSAACLVLLGVALLLLGRTDEPPDARRRRAKGVVGRVMAAVAATVGGLTLAEHVSGVDFGIDQILFREAPGAAATTSPGRMGPPASLSFLLSGLALLLLDVRVGRRRALAPAQWLAFLVGLVAMLPLMGYAYGIEPLYGISKYTGIAMHTAASIFLMAVGLLAARPTAGLMRVVCLDDAGGVLARRMLLPAVLVPLALGWLRTVAQRAGLIDDYLGRPLLVLSLVVTFTGLVWWNARALSAVARQRAAIEDERRRTDEARRMVEFRFQRLVERSPLSTQLFWPDGRTRQVNAAFTNLWGITFDELRDYNILRDPQLVATGIMPLMERAFAGEAVAIEPIRYAPDRGAYVGQQRWVGAQVYPVKDDAGRVEEVVLVHIDVTEQRRAEDERDRLLVNERAARVEAERANRLKDEFLANLSHELRTPLNAILGWAQILRAGASDAAEVAEAAGIIERNGRAQSRIVEDLLDMSRIVSGRLMIDARAVELSEVVRAAVETVRPAADAKGVTVQTVLDPRAGPVRGDASRLQQVFWNLLANAVKFTPRGGRVRVTLGRVGSLVEVAVSDTGEGIDAAFLPHAFERFRQGDGSTTRRHGGLGLGLSIVKQLVEQHGGTVRAESEGIGRGATFTVGLPVMETAAAGSAEAVTPPAPPGNGEEHRIGGAAGLDGVRVLIVDDDPDARALIERLLKQRGAATTTAASAAEAIELLGERRFDVLVSDIGMPGEDGYALIRRVRALAGERGGDTPAIALSAYARPEDRTSAMLAGFRQHLAKPVEAEELAAAVAVLAGRTGGVNQP